MNDKRIRSIKRINSYTYGYAGLATVLFLVLSFGLCGEANSQIIWDEPLTSRGENFYQIQRVGSSTSGADTSYSYTILTGCVRYAQSQETTNLFTTHIPDYTYDSLPVIYRLYDMLIPGSPEPFYDLAPVDYEQPERLWARILYISNPHLNDVEDIETNFDGSITYRGGYKLLTNVTHRKNVYGQEIFEEAQRLYKNPLGVVQYGHKGMYPIPAIQEPWSENPYSPGAMDSGTKVTTDFNIKKYIQDESDMEVNWLLNSQRGVSEWTAKSMARMTNATSIVRMDWVADFTNTIKTSYRWNNYYHKPGAYMRWRDVVGQESYYGASTSSTNVYPGRRYTQKWDKYSLGLQVKPKHFTENVNVTTTIVIGRPRVPVE